MNEQSPKAGYNKDAGANTAKDSLLDELESIKDVLEESDLDEEALDGDLDIDIPILDDVVGDQQNNHPAPGGNLLDLHAIFDEDETPEAPTSTGDLLREKTQLDFDGLDTDIEIPSFKLSFGNTPETGDTEWAAEPTGKQPSPDDLTELALPGESCAKSPSVEDILPDDLDELITDDEANIPVLELETTEFITPTPVDIDLLVQELVDEVVPQIEARLRQRLAGYPAEVIRELAKKYLQD